MRPSPGMHELRGPATKASMRYARPAVYVERPDALEPAPLVLRTDIAAFVGIARRGPLDTAVLVESFRQFVAHFGEVTGAGYLAYAVRGFFENGGRRCWVVRVANKDAAGGARTATATILDSALRPALHVATSSPGTWGNALTLEWAVESGPTAIGLPASTTPHYATVASVAGFEPGSLASIEQIGVPAVHRVISAVDPERRRLYWVHPEPHAGYRTDRALHGMDPSQPLRVSRLAYSLTVREAGRVRAVYRDLHLVRDHERSVARVLAEPDYRPYWLAPDRNRDADLPRPAEPVVITLASDDPDAIPQPLAVPATGGIAMAGGTDGLAALVIDDFLGEPTTAGDSDFVKYRKRRGLQALAEIDEIALVAMPDILIRPDPDPAYDPVAPPRGNPCVLCPPPSPEITLHQPLPPGELPPVFSDAEIARAQASLLTHCETLDDRIAVLSLPFDLATRATGSREQILAWRRQFDSRYGALYVPWLDVLDARDSTATRLVPACGHIVGTIARSDLTTGVQRAPGNLPIRGVTDLSRDIGDVDHGELNLGGVNVLRGEFGRQPTIGGARSLSFDPDWRFLNIVRLVLTIKKAIHIALRWIVFEPNDHATRAAVTATLTALLQLFFERGAFKGATPEQSYFVLCDEVTTPREARDAGQLIARIGIAPAAPCEFIVLRVWRERNSLSVTLFDGGAAHAA